MRGLEDKAVGWNQFGGDYVARVAGWRMRDLALGQVTDALEIDYALVAGESVDVLEAGLARASLKSFFCDLTRGLTYYRHSPAVDNCAAHRASLWTAGAAHPCDSCPPLLRHFAFGLTRCACQATFL